MIWNLIGIIGAMQEEINELLNNMSDMKHTEKAGILFHSGQIEGQPIILCKCGVGKVNAAVCTQILIDTFQVEAVIFTGVAGALHPDLQIGDLVISSDCMQHDMDVSPLGFARGMIPYADTSIFPADPLLIKHAYECSTAAFAGSVMIGRVLSGDQFIANRDTVRNLYSDLNGACTEMEGAAVAQTCYMNHIPYVVIRSMSDQADGSAVVNFSEFTIMAAKHSHSIVMGMMKKLN